MCVYVELAVRSYVAGAASGKGGMSHILCRWLLKSHQLPGLWVVFRILAYGNALCLSPWWINGKTASLLLCFAIPNSCLFIFLRNFIFSLHQAWLIVDFHRITTIIHWPGPQSALKFPQQTGRKNQNSLILRNHASLLIMGHGCQIPISLRAVGVPLVLPKESIWSIVWRSLSFEEDMVLEKTKQNRDLFFLLSNSSFSSPPFSFFFYLRYHFPSNVLFSNSSLCYFCKIWSEVTSFCFNPFSVSLLPTR